jgi:hypothetical protein
MNATQDRTDRMRIEGTLRSKDEFGQWRTFTASSGGVEVAPGGVFEVGDVGTGPQSLLVRADSGNIGGSIRVAGGLDVGTAARPVTFTQTGGTTRLGLYGGGSLSLHDGARFEQTGGSLTVPSELTLATGSRFRLSGGSATAVVGLDVTLSGRSRLEQTGGR